MVDMVDTIIFSPTCSIMKVSLCFYLIFEMVRGTVPVMTKGSFATYFGGADVLKQIERQNGENLQPSLVFPAFFVVSSVFQIVLYLYKKVRSSQKRSIPSYLQGLRRNLGKYYKLFISYLTISHLYCLLSINRY